jgi:signal transduction histidine kinase
MELCYEEIDIKLVITETISMLIDMADKKSIKIELELENIVINADVIRIKQIMYNLLSNSIKFTKNGGIVCVRTSLDNDNLKVEVEDSGIGIAEKDKDKIFVQFSQIDSSYARKQEGTGLGLVLTKKLVELHNGFIDFESEENIGTKFRFFLPVAGKKPVT